MMSVRRLRNKLFSGALALGLVCCVPAWAQRRNAAPQQQQLYLLAGTATNYSTDAYPVSLYRINASDKKLNLVRVVVSVVEGLYSVHTAKGAIFVAYPHINPTAVSIIHTDDPRRADEVIFNPRRLISIQNREVLAAPKLSSVDQLFPLVTSKDSASVSNGMLVGISSNLARTGSRLKFDTWDEYSALLFDGEPGGPFASAAPLGRIIDGNIALSVFGHDIPIESVPPFLHGPYDKTIIWFMAVSGDYSILAPVDLASLPKSRKPVTSQEVFVHDQVRKRWKKMEIEGYGSRLRLFDPWLATIVSMENPDHKVGPGRQNERNYSTDRLPNVQASYAFYTQNEGRDGIRLPGILVLQNLADGRKIRIVTGQEDSEILWVGDDQLLYRVNDTIYQARIEGDKIESPTVMVKDEDVPEIHWFFWGK